MLTGFYAEWPFFACMAALLVLASTPAFRAADTPPSPRPNRLGTLDGLRGFLALAVVFNHVAVYHKFLLSGQWTPAPSRFYALLGPIGVSMFFMVTGYLFWSRLIGERGKPSWVSLYVGRFFRIGPLYLAAMSVVLLIVFARTGFTHHVTGPELAHELRMNFALGLGGNILDVNGYLGTGTLLANATWTIKREWLFNFSLPLVGLPTRSAVLHLPFTVVGLIASSAAAALYPARTGLVWDLLFLAGMTCASLHEKGLSCRLSDNVASVIVIFLLPVVFFFPDTYSVIPALLLGGVFYLITSGCSVFGLLVSRPARRLGDISYGICLLQGLALAALFQPEILRSLAVASPVYHWGLGLLSAVLLIFIATAAHVVIERPGIALGRRVSAAVTGPAMIG
jgi:peptidoglycan/LPS O-acetylase OafA/YrhL